MKTQNEQIIEWLQSGRPLTSYQALIYFQCFRLASRIYDLNQKGHTIKKEWIVTEQSKKKVIRYSYGKV
jgi:hypothetical protein